MKVFVYLQSYIQWSVTIVDMHFHQDIDMTRDDRRKSYLKSEVCHMCGHVLGPGMSFKTIPGGQKEVRNGMASDTLVFLLVSYVVSRSRNHLSKE